MPSVVPEAVVSVDASSPMNSATGKPKSSPTARSRPRASLPMTPNADPPTTTLTSPTESCAIAGHDSHQELVLALQDVEARRLAGRQRAEDGFVAQVGGGELFR